MIGWSNSFVIRMITGSSAIITAGLEVISSEEAVDVRRVLPTAMDNSVFVMYIIFIISLLGSVLGRHLR